MGVAFGTSGIRALAAELTDRECILYTTAFLRYLDSRGWGGRVLLAGDLRESTPRILQAVAYGLRRGGRELLYCGTLPTPALLLAGMAEGRASIMVTGSHIAAERNGIKFALPHGEVLKEDEREIARLCAGLRAEPPGPECGPDGMLAPGLRPELGEPDPHPAGRYVRRYLEFFPAQCLGGLRVRVYQHSSVSRDLLVEVLRALGARVEAVGRSEGFVAVDTEAVPNARRLAAWARGRDALVSTDGDGDRPLLVDGRGALVPGDLLGILTARSLGARSVSLPVSCNSAVEACGWFAEVRRTRIGSPYVIASMNEALRGGADAVAGFEANGGFLTASGFPGGAEAAEAAGGVASSAAAARAAAAPALRALPTRDALLPLLCVLAEARRRGLSIAELVGELPRRRTAAGLLRGVGRQAAAALLERLQEPGGQTLRRSYGKRFGALESVDRTDGLRLRFAGGTIVHLRPSGNAPEFRVYVEADSQGAARRALRSALRITGRLLRRCGRA